MFLFNKTLDQYGRVSWAFGCVLGSRPEESPCPSSLCTPCALACEHSISYLARLSAKDRVADTCRCVNWSKQMSPCRVAPPLVLGAALEPLHAPPSITTSRTESSRWVTAEVLQRDNFLGVLLGRCQQAHGVSESGPWAVGRGRWGVVAFSSASGSVPRPKVRPLRSSFLFPS